MKDNCCFTGHRDIRREDEPEIRARVKAQVVSLISKGVDTFYVGGAVGFDMLAAELLILASQGFAVFIASAIPSLRWSLSLCTLWGVLSIPISGFSFPVMGMPAPLQALSYLFPLRYYFLIYVDQALNGIPMVYSAWFYTALLAFLILPLVDISMLRKAALEYTYLP